MDVQEGCVPEVVWPWAGEQVILNRPWIISYRDCYHSVLLLPFTTLKVPL